MWAERSDKFSPAYYAELGPNKVSRSLVTVLDHCVDREAAVLEVGCSSGRHLAHLHEHGYENLTGVDVNDDAFDVMADHFPTLAAEGTFHAGAIEDVLPEFADDAFDVVYSVETLQHIHPDDDWVFEELARVTGDLLVTTENEGDPNGDEAREDWARDDTRGDGRQVDGAERVNYVNGEFPLYYRNWEQVFGALGLEQIRAKPGTRDTIRVFRVP